MAAQGQEQLLAAIAALYHDPDPKVKEEANRWLEQWQQTVQAWQTADAVLHDAAASTEALYFAAQTLRTKVPRPPPGDPLCDHAHFFHARCVAYVLLLGAAGLRGAASRRGSQPERLPYRPPPAAWPPHWPRSHAAVPRNLRSCRPCASEAVELGGGGALAVGALVSAAQPARLAVHAGAAGGPAPGGWQLPTSSATGTPAAGV